MSFITHFEEITDGRTDINIRYDLLDVVFLTLVAILSGAEGWQDIERFGTTKLNWLRKHRAFKEGIPRRHTIARIISGIKPDSLLSSFVSWVNELRVTKGQSHIAIDGKTLRGSHTGNRDTALHLVTAMAIDSGLVLHQKPSTGKKNEIKTVQRLLDDLDLNEACVTIDAMHCQKATVSKLRQQSADYIIQVKANQGYLYEQIKAFFHKTRRDNPDTVRQGQFTELDKGHGRIEQRCYSQLKVTDWFDKTEQWQDLNTVIEVKRTTELATATREESSYYISSLPVNADKVADKIRHHWQIENSQHWVLDVSYREDDSRIRTGDAPQNMGLFRRFAFNISKLSNVKDSMKGKLKRAAWDDDFRDKLLFG